MEGDDSTTRAGSTTKLNVVDGGRESYQTNISEAEETRNARAHRARAGRKRQQQKKEAKEEGKRKKRMGMSWVMQDSEVQLGRGWESTGNAWGDPGEEE